LRRHHAAEPGPARTAEGSRGTPAAGPQARNSYKGAPFLSHFSRHFLRFFPRISLRFALACRLHRMQRANQPMEIVMLYYAAVFFVIALIAALFGFGGIAAGAAGIAEILFYIFLVVALVSLVAGLIRR
jgi:uncharacterized membrane protein YtjA (UPF0391 family)